MVMEYVGPVTVAASGCVLGGGLGLAFESRNGAVMASNAGYEMGGVWGGLFFGVGGAMVGAAYGVIAGSVRGATSGYVVGDMLFNREDPAKY